MAKVDNRVSLLVSSQIPQFIQDEHVLFSQFLKFYFEFLETICVYFTEITDYSADFTLGETVTGQTSGATATVKAPSALSTAGTSRGIFVLPTSETADFANNQIFLPALALKNVYLSYYGKHQ